MKSHIDLRILPNFIEVAQTMNFTKAARNLGIGKAKLSKDIAHLEEQLRVKLFQRTTRKISLTNAGMIFLEHVLKAHHIIEDAQTMVRADHDNPHGKIEILAPMSFGKEQVIPLLMEFKDMYPNIAFNLHLSDDKQDIVDKKYDLALTTGKLVHSNMYARRLCPLNSIICTSTHYLNGRKISHPSELKKYNCVLYSHSNPYDEWKFKCKNNYMKVKVSGDFIVDNSEALMNVLLMAGGIGRIPTFLAHRYLKEKRLIQVLDAYEMPSKDLYVIYRDKALIPYRMRLIIDFFVNKLYRKKPTWDE